jgi:sugar lactone lactonase YvrE
MTRSTLLALCLVSLVAALAAADRTTITFADGRIFPESLTSTKDGAIYFGSLGQKAVYRAPASSAQATVWIKPETNGLNTVLGVFADERAGVLWVCSSTSGGRNGAPVVGETALKAFALKDASLAGSYPFPGNGACNDIAVASDGTTYATDTSGGRVLRLKKGATKLDVWIADPVQLATADGIAILGDGAVYVNSVGQSTLMRIPVNKDGSAGAITKLEPSRPLKGPDGMRAVGAKTLLLVEGDRLDEVTINGTRADVKVLAEGMTGGTAVTLAGGRMSPRRGSV